MIRDSASPAPADALTASSGVSARAAVTAIYTYFVVTVSFLDTMAQLPLLSPFAASLGAGPTSIGFILGAYSLVNMMGNVIAGPVIDRIGRRYTIASGMLVAGLAVAAYAFVVAPWQLLGARLLHGLGGAVLVPAVFAHVGDRSRGGRTGQAMGHAGAAVAVAAMVGPALGGIGRSALGIRPVFLILGGLLVGTSISVALFVRDRSGSAATRRGPLDLSGIRRAAADRALRYAYLSVSSLTFAMGVLAYAFPLSMQAAGASAGRTGSFFSVFSAAAILVLVLPTNRLSDRYGRPPMVVIGSAAVAIAVTGLVFARQTGHLTLVMALFGIGYGVLFPSACAIVVDRTDATTRGTAFGLFYAAFSLGVTVGPVAAGVATVVGFSPYWAAVGVIVTIRLLLGANRNRRQPKALTDAPSDPPRADLHR